MDPERGENPKPRRNWNLIVAAVMLFLVLPSMVGVAVWAYKADGNQIPTGYTALGGLVPLALAYAKFLSKFFPTTSEV